MCHVAQVSRAVDGDGALSDITKGILPDDMHFAGLAVVGWLHRKDRRMTKSFIQWAMIEQSSGGICTMPWWVGEGENQRGPFGAMFLVKITPIERSAKRGKAKGKTRGKRQGKAAK